SSGCGSAVGYSNAPDPTIPCGGLRSCSGYCQRRSICRLWRSRCSGSLSLRLEGGRLESGPELASAPSEGSYVVVRFAPQASADEITKFLDAYKATVGEGPLNGPLYAIRRCAA